MTTHRVTLCCKEDPWIRFASGGRNDSYGQSQEPALKWLITRGITACRSSRPGHRPGVDPMDAPATPPVTRLLRDAQAGNAAALEAILPIVYDELRRLARKHLAHERSGHTLQATALVHEAYLRLIDQHSVDWANRAHFFAIAAQMMRRVLVNHAEARQAAKRGGGADRLTLSAAEGVASPATDVVALDSALRSLEKLDARQAQIVELRYFGGLGIDEVASALSLSPATVKREWATAKLWLKRELAQ